MPGIVIANMYEKANSGAEALSPWQLLNKTYEMLLVESKSLVGVVKHKVTKPDVSKTEYKVATLKISNKIKTVMYFLESLLVEGEEFSHSMASLYSWYLSNLDVLIDEGQSPMKRKEAATNLVKQAEGFVEIWGGMRHAG